MKALNWPKFDSDHVMVSSLEMLNFENDILSNGMPVEGLMEKVGQSMSRWLLGEYKLLKEGVLVLVGPGHNGGDGLVVARELHLSGIKVKIWCPYSIKKKLTQNYLYSVGLKEDS